MGCEPRRKHRLQPLGNHNQGELLVNFRFRAAGVLAALMEVSALTARAQSTAPNPINWIYDGASVGK